MMWMILFFFMVLILNLKMEMFLNMFLHLNYLTILMFSIVLMSSIFILLFKFNFTNKHSQELYAFMFVLIFFMTFISFSISDSFLFIMMVEMCVYPMSFLILNYSKDKDKTSALIYMFGINILGSIPFMMFSVKMLNHKMMNSMTMPMIYNFNLNYLMFLLFVLMLISKIPLFLFHFWLTKAHVAASGSCSMILASIMLKLGTFGLYKFGLNFIFLTNSIFNFSLSFVMWGYLLISIIMVRLFDVKYMVACSSILHMSLIYPFVMYFSYESLISSSLMMVGHGLVSYYLFYLVSLNYEKTTSRSMELTKSLESTEKNLSFVIFIFIFMNLGLPPFISFYSEMIFLKFMIMNSYLMSFSFSMLMILSIVFLMFYISKSLFGKKYQFEYKNSSMNLNFNTMIFLFSLIVLTLLN